MSSPPIKWSALLADAVAKPGVISEAYRRFWNYSTGNQLLARFQCAARGLEPGPIHTFQGWKELGRWVRKGEKALTLCMPVTVRKRKKPRPDAETEAPGHEDAPSVCFLYRPHWFVLSQTEGMEYHPADLPEWNEDRALAALDVIRVAFRYFNGNVQGYAHDREVAVSPIAFAPQQTLFHEVAHVVLGHTEENERMEDEEATPISLREVEAEAVALICCESLGLGGAEFSRGYVQHWGRGNTIPERSARRIFKAADRILRAGRPATSQEKVA